MPGDAPRAEWPDYELVDAGELRRLERFGPRRIDRPAPTALDRKRNPRAWAEADLRFDAGTGWTARGGETRGDGPVVEPWTVGIEGLVLELRPTASGGLGLYPEHMANLAWVADQVAWSRSASPSDIPPAVLNLFAHTGLATLVAARAGAAVTHVDGARGSVGWARRNAELSGLVDRPVRWIVDDAAAFVAREARRGRRYDGIILDPPSFGRAKRRRWRLEDELSALLAACRDIATHDTWMLLTAHTGGLDAAILEAMLREAFPAPRRRISAAPLGLEATSGARLELGSSVRLTL
jgi:23S rRNA (cytosine1962-C5)-methyltransferase